MVESVSHGWNPYYDLEFRGIIWSIEKSDRIESKSDVTDRMELTIYGSLGLTHLDTKMFKSGWSFFRGAL